MEPSAFLDGKYRNPELFTSGPVEGFRAREAKTGKYVFVHRVSSSERAEEQVVLLRLLLTATFQSESVRKMVLDFGEDGGAWYVVTEGEPECLLLKKWLETEAKKTAGSAPLKRPEEVETVIGPMSKPAEPGSFVSEPGEFTRIFRPAPPSAVDTVSQEQQTAPAERARAESQPGEFTRFFQEGLPPSKNSGVGSGEQFQADRQPEREWPPRTRAVQRPPTGFGRLSESKGATEPGEFTKLFSQPSFSQESASRVNKDVPSFGDRKSNVPEVPAPGEGSVLQSAPAGEPGEYTRIFGPGDAPPAVQPPSSVAGSVTPLIREDTQKIMRPTPASPLAAPAASEYTRVIRPDRAAGSGSSPAPVASPETSLNLPLAKPAIPEVKRPTVAVSAAKSQQNLIWFFVILGVVTVLLILFVWVVLRK